MSESSNFFTLYLKKSIGKICLYPIKCGSFITFINQSLIKIIFLFYLYYKFWRPLFYIKNTYNAKKST